MMISHKDFVYYSNAGENVAYKKKAYQSNVAYTYGPDILTDGFHLHQQDNLNGVTYMNEMTV